MDEFQVLVWFGEGGQRAVVIANHDAGFAAIIFGVSGGELSTFAVTDKHDVSRSPLVPHAVPHVNSLSVQVMWTFLKHGVTGITPEPKPQPPEGKGVATGEFMLRIRAVNPDGEVPSRTVWLRPWD